MIKILFVCHGTTLISLEIPPKTTIFFAFYYKFTTFFEFRYDFYCKESSPKGGKIRLFRDCFFYMRG